MPSTKKPALKRIRGLRIQNSSLINLILAPTKFGVEISVPLLGPRQNRLIRLVFDG